MNFNTEWLEQRRREKERQKANADAVVMQWFEDVVTGEEEFVWYIGESVEFVESGKWAVEPKSLEVELKPGERVLLLSGRNGVREYATVGAVLSLGRYSLVF
jgi:hypothetical protein